MVIEPDSLAFNDAPVLIGATLRLDPLRDLDRSELTAAAADERTWAGHPAPDRHKPEVFGPYFDFLLRAGGALTVRKAGKVIGCSRYYPVPDQSAGIGIGFTFLNSLHWGGTVNFELKELMLDHAFKALPDVWFHIAPSNIRSQKATAKLGAVHEYDTMLDLSGTPVFWTCWRLDEASWKNTKAARAAAGQT